MKLLYTIFESAARGDGLAVVLNSSTKCLKQWLWDIRVRLLLGLAISVALGWLSVRGIEWGLVAEQFQHFPIGWGLASLAVIVVASFLRAYRWQVLFVEHKLPLMRLFLVQNAGIGLNNVVPLRVVSEGAQFAFLTLRYRVKAGVALATLGMERVLDLVVTAALLMAGLTLLPSRGDFLPYVVGAFVVALASVLAVPLLIWVSGKPLMNRIPLLVSTAGTLLDLAKDRVAIPYAFLLTLVHWLLVGLCAWVLAFGMDLGITPFVATLTIIGTLYFATSLPALPAAVGTFEFAVVYVLKVFDVPQSLAFSYAVMIHAVLFLPPIVVAMAVFASMGMRLPDQRDSTRPPDGENFLPIGTKERKTI